MQRDNSFVYAVLKTMVRDIDPKLEKLRTAYNNTNHTNWFVCLHRNVFLSFNYKKVSTESQLNKVNVLFSNSFFLYICSILGVSVPFIINYVPKIIMLLPLLSFIYSYIIASSRMLNIEDPCFHYRFYQLFRKQEFNMLNKLVETQHFSFSALFEWTRDEINKNQIPTKLLDESYHNLIKSLEEAHARIDEQAKRLSDNDNSFRELEKIYDALSRSHESVTEMYTKAIYVIRKLSRKETFDVNLLSIISDFSLYEVRKDKLHLIIEHGCIDINKYIDPYDVKYNDFGVVKTFKTQKISESYLDFPGRRTVSSLIHIDQYDTKYIYSFHYLNNSDIIKNIVDDRETYLLIKAILVHLIERNRIGQYIFKEASSDG